MDKAESLVIPAEAVEAAAKEFYGAAWGDHSPENLQYALIQMREALEAAAPHMLVQVTTLEELDALPFGSVILDPNGLSLHKNEHAGWRASNGAKGISQAMLEQEALPATVLHVGATK